MSYTPPFNIPESRKNDESIHDRIARARKAREDAGARVAERCSKIKPDTRRWTTGPELKIKEGKLYVQ